MLPSVVARFLGGGDARGRNVRVSPVVVVSFPTDTDTDAVALLSAESWAIGIWTLLLVLPVCGTNTSVS